MRSLDACASGELVGAHRGSFVALPSLFSGRSSREESCRPCAAPPASPRSADGLVCRPRFASENVDSWATNLWRGWETQSQTAGLPAPPVRQFAQKRAEGPANPYLYGVAFTLCGYKVR